MSMTGIHGDIKVARRDTDAVILSFPPLTEPTSRPPGNTKNFQFFRSAWKLFKARPQVKEESRIPNINLVFGINVVVVIFRSCGRFGRETLPPSRWGRRLTLISSPIPLPETSIYDSSKRHGSHVIALKFYRRTLSPLEQLLVQHLVLFL